MVHSEKHYSQDPLDFVPATNSAEQEVPLLPSGRSQRFGVHVLFNMLGSLLRRYNKPIDGTIRQKHFVQSLVSTVFGLSFPVLFLQAKIFPNHR